MHGVTLCWLLTLGHSPRELEELVQEDGLQLAVGNTSHLGHGTGSYSRELKNLYKKGRKAS